ncbi:MULTISPECIES: ABC transporter permease subunit [unclassified Rhizobium]|jgi:putative spermidine/putrescine transport system permease protein|uniref:ABC transporter permease n=1 Tax=unclassified Rhizobium TaxID=2613769 RepID=UPI00064661BA|nr:MULTISPECIES: ABC transporter permease subunit [unclassified Rhizobium]MBN8952494.1 sugar ABC transporter permease [Rhizobium tropici]OJY78970.1 MAG: ABC transporter permease [Rhizobium sp. 60-20]RKD67695.1 ABC-type sugar transport system permease subunit [Rhizobium sp. WW_1]
MPRQLIGLLLVLPALAVIALLFILPMVMSGVGAFQLENGAYGFGNFQKSFDLYWKDILFTVVIVSLSSALVGLFSVAIGGYLTLGGNPAAIAILRWLYRWPLFIPFIVVGQILRTFLSKSGLMNSTAISLGLITPIDATSLLDWRGIVFAFVWKQTPFVAMLVAGAMASVNRDNIEAARNLGAGSLRILVGILLPQVAITLTVGLVLSFVTMMSVLSVPMMINAQSPTMLTADIAFRVNAYGDYGVANALGIISLVLACSVAWIYLRQNLRTRA